MVLEVCHRSSKCKLTSRVVTDSSQGTKNKLSGSLHELGGGTSELTTRFLAKSITLAGLTHALTTYSDGLSPLTTHVLFGEVFSTSLCIIPVTVMHC